MTLTKPERDRLESLQAEAVALRAALEGTGLALARARDEASRAEKRRDEVRAKLAAEKVEAIVLRDRATWLATIARKPRQFERARSAILGLGSWGKFFAQGVIAVATVFFLLFAVMKACGVFR